MGSVPMAPPSSVGREAGHCLGRYGARYIAYADAHVVNTVREAGAAASHAATVLGTI